MHGTWMQISNATVSGEDGLKGEEIKAVEPEVSCV